MARKPLLIVNAGKTHPEIAALADGDFDDWIAAGLDRTVSAVETVSPFTGDPLPPASNCSGVIITGSHDMVTDHLAWSERTADWIASVVAAGVPLLGICYGHQLLAHAMGGVVGDNPNGKEIGTVSIRLNREGRLNRLFADLPDSFAVHACHTQSVLELPVGASLLASSTRDPHHAFAIGEAAWGIQFHPEFNSSILQAYIQRMAGDLKAQGDDVPGLLAAIRETPHSEGLLRRFQRLCT